MDSDRDFELLDRWQAGDRAAGNQLFKRYFDPVWRFFASKIDRDIDELVQTTFLACVRSRDRFRKQSSFRTYLYTIARNELYGYLRRRRRAGEQLDFGVTSLADLNTGPSSRLARDQDHKRLLHALGQLPVEQQVMLELHYWEELSPTQLAEIFEVPPSTMRTRLHRARAALRQAMSALADVPEADLASDKGLDTWARSMRLKRSPSDRDSGSDGSP